MASNSTSEYKVVADKIVSPDEDIIIELSGDMYKGSISEPNRYATISDVGEGGGAANTGDITFDGVQIIGAGTASGDGLGNGTIELVPDATLNSDQYIIIDPTGPNHIHIRAGGAQDASNTELTLGGEKTNVKVIDNSGTVKISTTYENNIIQLSNEGVTTSSTFLTTTNPELHYVIGEGWTVKNANGSVTVPLTDADSPEPGEVTFTVAEEDFFVPEDSYQFFPPTDNPDGDIQWEFAPNGAIYGPAMGGVKVPAINNVQAGEDLYIYSDKARIVVSADKDVSIYSDEGDIILNSDVGGVFLGSSNSSDNEIATIEDIRKYYGAFYHTETVELTSATTAYSVPLNSIAETLGVSVVSNSRITVDNAGVYNIQFSLQLDKTDSGDDLVNLWLSKNNANVAWSNTQVTVVGNNGKYVAAWNFVITLAANDYVELKIQSPSTAMRILASSTQTTPDRPAVPSSIVTITQVS